MFRYYFVLCPWFGFLITHISWLKIYTFIHLFHFNPRCVFFTSGFLEAWQTNEMGCVDVAIAEASVNWNHGWKREERRRKGGRFVPRCCDQSSAPAFCYNIQQNSYPSIGLNWEWGGFWGASGDLYSDLMSWTERFKCSPISNFTYEYVNPTQNKLKYHLNLRDHYPWHCYYCLPLYMGAG